MATTSNLCRIFLITLIFIQAGCWAAGTTKKTTKVPDARAMNPAEAEKIISARIKSTPKSQLNRYKTDAAKRLQSNLVRVLRAISSNDKGIPTKVRSNAKSALAGIQSGKLTGALTNNLADIMKQTSGMQGNAAQQLQTVLASVIPNAPSALKSPLQGLLDFVSSNLAGVNTLLGRLLGGVPDLLSGVVKSLLTNLGAVTATVNGTLSSLGALLGSLLS